MKRLDQGHLHPKLEVPGLTCAGRESNPGLRRWEASTLEKSHSHDLLTAIRNSYVHMSPQQSTVNISSYFRVKQYFYGPSGNLFPHSFDVPFSEVKDRIYKIGNKKNT